MEESKEMFLPRITTTLPPSSTTLSSSIADQLNINASLYITPESDISTSITEVDSLTSENTSNEKEDEGGLIGEDKNSQLMEKVWVAKVILSRNKASAKNSGVYTCTNTCTRSLNLTLHVLLGELHYYCFNFICSV